VDLSEFPERRRAELHLDFVQRSYTRTCKSGGRDRERRFGISLRRKCAGSPRRDGAWKSIPYKFEINDMYVAEMVHFLESLGSGTGPLVDLEQGRDVIRVVEAAKRSSKKEAAKIELDERKRGTGGGDHPGAHGFEPVAGQESG
jgi:predicted dehydrogenase